jgi:hypothetical protein
VEDYARKHQLLERGVEGTGKSVEYVAGVFTGTKTDKTVNDKEEKSESRFQEERKESGDTCNYTKVSDSEPKND